MAPIEHVDYRTSGMFPSEKHRIHEDRRPWKEEGDENTALLNALRIRTLRSVRQVWVVNNGVSVLQ